MLRPHLPAELGLDHVETAENDGFAALDAHLTAAGWSALVDLDRATFPR